MIVVFTAEMIFDLSVGWTVAILALTLALLVTGLP